MSNLDDFMNLKLTSKEKLSLMELLGFQASFYNINFECEF